MRRTLRASTGELTVDRIIEVLNTGRRVVIQIETGGRTHEVELRLNDDGRYCCDTPRQLHTHETEREMRAWLVDQGYAIEEPVDDV